MDAAIKNSAELKLEIERSKSLLAEQEKAIKQHFNSPRAILGTITSFFQRKHHSNSAFDISKYDISGLISKFILPLTLNKTLFRRSGVMAKALVTAISQRASGLLSDDRVASIWQNIRSHIPNDIKKALPQRSASSLNP